METWLLTRWLLDMKINIILRFDPLLGHIGADETATRLVRQATMNDMASAAVELYWPREVVSIVLDRNPLCLFHLFRHDCDFESNSSLCESLCEKSLWENHCGGDH